MVHWSKVIFEEVHEKSLKDHIFNSPRKFFVLWNRKSDCGGELPKLLWNFWEIEKSSNICSKFKRLFHSFIKWHYFVVFRLIPIQHYWRGYGPLNMPREVFYAAVESKYDMYFKHNASYKLFRNRENWYLHK